MAIRARLASAMAGVAALAGLIGWAFGPTYGWAMAAILYGWMLLGHHAGLSALSRWVSQSRLTDPPEADGEWGDVFNQLHKHRRQWMRRRRELARLMVRSRRAVEALPYGVALLDGENRIEWCNETTRAHLGIESERDRGQPIVNFVRDPEFAEYLGSGDLAPGVVLHPGGAGGRSLELRLVVVDEAARLLLSQDVTSAERVAAMRRDFVANASHELRTPLTVLAGFLETIRDLRLEPDRVRDYIALMAPQAERMARIIDDLLMLSSIENAPHPAPDRVPVRRVIDMVASQARTLSSGRHRIEVALDGTHDLVGSETEIASAFGNLVTNAVRYTPEGGRISLRWSSGAEGGTFAVEDTGIGIPPEHIPRLTERFYRVDRGRSRETGGTGLGLAIVKHALARHHATLEITSEPGRGSTFAARFPPSQMLSADRGATVAG